MSETQTNIEQTQVEDLDNLLGMPGADSVMTPAEEKETEKPSFFSSKQTDLSAFDHTGTDEVKETEETKEVTDESTDSKETVNSEESFADIVNDITVDESEEDVSNAGRPKLDKGGMAQLTQKLIDEKLILPFDDDKSLDDYTLDDFKELFSVNFQEKERKVREQTPKEFFEALPHELQYAAQYVAEGGTDLKNLFKHLAAAEEIKTLAIDNERGQEQIVREYLRAKQFGSEEDIQEEIESWKDLGKLEEKAVKFKPELDKMQEQLVQRQVLQQEAKRKQQEDASHAYMENVYNTLETGDLNGIKLNSKIQNMLYAGLVQPNYPSVSGKNTNLFGHLIEKYQFVEPRHDLIAEALWLLADPQGYKDQLRIIAKNEATAETARTLKTEQANKNTTVAEPETGERNRRSTLARPSKDFFKR